MKVQGKKRSNFEDEVYGALLPAIGDAHSGLTQNTPPIVMHIPVMVLFKMLKPLCFPDVAECRIQAQKTRS
jgi:hypothetical protein